MSLRDYILCEVCQCKLVYDGGDSIRSSPEEKYGDPSSEVWTIELLCPECLRKLRAERDTEREALLADAERYRWWAKNPYSNFSAAWRAWDGESDFRVAVDAARKKT